MAVAGVASVFAVCGGPAPALAAQTLWTSYLRVGPGPQFAVMQELPAGTVLDVAGCQSGWCQVRFGSAVGYVRQKLVGEPAAAAPSAAAGTDCFDTVRSGHPGGSHVRICRR